MKKIFLYTQCCFLSLLIVSCTHSSRSLNHTLTQWHMMYPTSSQDLNLVGAVKTVRLKTYTPILEDGHYVRGSIQKVTHAEVASNKSYEIEFSELGVINHIISLSHTDQVLNKQVSIIDTNGQYIGFFNYDAQGNPEFKAEYNYTQDTLIHIESNSELADGYWAVDFDYPSLDEMSYTQKFYEGILETKERIINQRVHEVWEKHMAEGDTETTHHEYVYNAYNDIVKDHVVLSGIYLGAPKGHQNKVSYERSYIYTYDKKGNWITRVVLRDGKALDYQTRDIVYY